MDREHLRRTDLWTGLGLAAVAVAMLIGASRFPISASYGGVRNVWYVSPALFPLIVGVGILVLSLVLVATAARSLGRGGLRQALSLPEASFGPRHQRFAMIVVAIVGFVYAMVPAVDFFLATALFLLVFMAAFHLPDGRGLLPNLYVYSMLVAMTVVWRLVGLGGTTGLTHGLDILTLAGLAGGIWINWRITAGDPTGRKRLRHVLWMVAVTPALLCVLFRYGLLVPLPHEGLVINLMEAARYALRG